MVTRIRLTLAKLCYNAYVRLVRPDGVKMLYLGQNDAPRGVPKDMWLYFRPRMHAALQRGYQAAQIGEDTKAARAVLELGNIQSAIAELLRMDAERQADSIEKIRKTRKGGSR